MENSASFFIIVPTLNSYRLLSPLIKSLENQSFKNWRLLFVDGNSKKKHVDYLNKVTQKDKRLFWINQKKEFKGIYGAMNQGIKYAKNNDWIMFWGSDDKAANSKTLRLISEVIEKTIEIKPYLIINKCKYYDLFKLKKRRNAFFLNNKINKLINWRYFSILLFFGASPPHQGIVFSPKAIKNKKIYDESYDIAADLKYFLGISLNKQAPIYCMSEVNILIGSGGISSLLIKRKLKQVFKAYFTRFNLFCIIPFLFRYFRKLISFVGL